MTARPRALQVGRLRVDPGPLRASVDARHTHFNVPARPATAT